MDDLLKNVYLIVLYDWNEVLFYCILIDYLCEMLLIVYILIVGVVI